MCLAQNLVVAGSVCVNELLAKNELNASLIASPTVVRDTTILRSKTRLYYLANGLERVVPKDDTSQKIEATLLKTAVQVTLKSKNDQVVVQQ